MSMASRMLNREMISFWLMNQNRVSHCRILLSPSRMVSGPTAYEILKARRQDSPKPVPGMQQTCASSRETQAERIRIQVQIEPGKDVEGPSGGVAGEMRHVSKQIQGEIAPFPVLGDHGRDEGLVSRQRLDTGPTGPAYWPRWW